MRAIRLAAFAAAFVTTAVGAVRAQNLVANADLDIDRADWLPLATGMWLDDDWADVPGSGSIQLRAVAPAADGQFVHQCVPLDGPGEIEVAAAIRFAEFLGADGRAYVGLSPRGALDCNAGSILVPYLQPISVSEPSDWIFQRSAPITPPDGALAYDVQLFVNKLDAPGETEGTFDAVYVPEAPSVAPAATALALVRMRRRKRSRGGAPR